MGCGARTNLSCDSTDQSDSRIVKEASRKEMLSSLVDGGGGGAWTAAALLFSWNENLGDHVQRTKQ